MSNVKDAMVVQIPERKTGRSSRDSSFVSNEREAVLEWKDALFCSDAQVFAARYGAKYEGKHSGKTGGQSLEHDEEARRQKEALGVMLEHRRKHVDVLCQQLEATKASMIAHSQAESRRVAAELSVGALQLEREARLL